MNTTGDRLKFQMDKKGLNPNKIGVLTKIHPSTIKNYLKNIGTPDSLKLDKVAEVLDTNLKWLLTGEGEIDREYHVKKPTTQKPNPPKGNAVLLSIDDETEIFVNKNGIRFFEYPNGTTKIEVIKIPFSAHASYLEVFNDEEKLMNEFSKTVFTVDKVAKGNYRAFDVKGDSMNGGGIYDTPSGAEVLAREIGRHLWLDGFHKTDYGFILLTKSAIYHKDIKNYNNETGTLTLSSRNPNEDDFEISINDVYQVFNVIKRTF